jgi:hypothetical protein
LSHGFSVEFYDNSFFFVLWISVEFCLNPKLYCGFSIEFVDKSEFINSVESLFDFIINPKFFGIVEYLFEFEYNMNIIVFMDIGLRTYHNLDLSL